MARGRNAKIRKAPMEQLEQPTAEYLAHGGFHRQFVTHVDSQTKAMVYVAAHDPVERWERAGRLSYTQMAAIGFMRLLWDRAGISQRVTASYGERIPGGGNEERRAAIEIDARKDLHRVQEYFPGKTQDYYRVFENVVRHGEPAGVVGSRLGFGGRSGADRAHTIVCFVADIISMKERL